MSLNRSNYATLIKHYHQQEHEDTKLTAEKQMILLQQYGVKSSKQFLIALCSGEQSAIDRLSLIANNKQLFFTIFLDDLFLEKLTSAGYTLLLLHLVSTIPQKFISRYLEVCHLVADNDEEVNHICHLIQEFCLC
ncbi:MULTISPECIES: hypothetical protein [unclassified Streptococcus]|uniref:hypothetical protein n=1 Tax=unclassified Streptococcus TaxID=2608887 RepID=UPI00359EB98D